ncbi:DUF3841 domain-containing protein, partial [Candidatus Bipolaricaulota bacterium]|nr:DUF3841 domain-containing protein [Candidatus Bipolaricaulota bacterium]
TRSYHSLFTTSHSPIHRALDLGLTPLIHFQAFHSQDSKRSGEAIGKTLFLQLSRLPVLATVSPMKDLGEKPIVAQSKLGTSCSSNTSPLRVWTIQPAEVLARLTAARVLYADPACVPKEFHHAYIWMCAQMRQRLPHYGGHYPWWGWHTPRPDLRGSGHLPRGTPRSALGTGA